jgi:hypothetical protein
MNQSKGDVTSWHLESGRIIMALPPELALRTLMHVKVTTIVTALVMFLAFLPTMLLFTSASLAANVNDDFSLDMSVNGRDMFASQSFSVTPDETLVFDLFIHDVLKPVEIQTLSIEIFFAGVPVSTITQELGRVVSPGETYRPEIQPVNARDYLSIWGINVTTGKYKAVIKLGYTTHGQAQIWTQSREVEVPGNPIATMAGVAAAILTGIAAGGLISLFKSMVGYSLEAQSLSGRKSLEAKARTNISSSLVAAIKRILVKDRCPECEEIIKHGFCRTCRKPARELQRSYRKRVYELSITGAKLLTEGEVVTIGELPQRLGITGALASDVTATIQNARLFRARKTAQSLFASAILTGISSALAGVLWVTVGGLSVLNTSTLMYILVLSILIPLVIARGLQMGMRHKYAQAPDPQPQTSAPNQT